MGRATLVALACFAGVACAQTPTDDIPVYESSTLRHDTYRVMKHVWTENWRSAFYLPSFSDSIAAVAAMKRQAAAAGADAITNVVCLPDEGWVERKATVYCHGQLIKFK